MKVKKIPQRSCLGCGLKTEKASLIRVVRRPDGLLLVDKRGKEPGRGAYICSKESCLKMAIKKKAIERALSVKLTADIIEELTGQLNKD